MGRDTTHSQIRNDVKSPTICDQVAVAFVPSYFTGIGDINLSDRTPAEEMASDNWVVCDCNINWVDSGFCDHYINADDLEFPICNSDRKRKK